MNDMRNKATIKYEIIIWRTAEDFFKKKVLFLNYSYCLFVNPLIEVKNTSGD